ncbi:hypothetical protein QBC45DRAFT_409535 [Copromyces sp. CBS 386.78]|nr:hypothetical protein QBC45DRAFT_409535 [Copromyces sp. CBS 386.78]
MVIPSIILQLAIVAFLPLTTTAQITTSLTIPNTEPTLKLRFQDPTYIAMSCTGSQKYHPPDAPNFKLPSNPDWYPTSGKNALKGINHLMGVKGMPKNGPGPRNCGRVYCEGTTAIYWCNNSDQVKELDDYLMIARAATAIFQDCSCWDKGERYCGLQDGVLGVLQGEVWTDAQWSVFIRGENCALGPHDEMFHP